MSEMVLQEVDATVLVSDVRSFSPLAAQLGPVELAGVLERCYEHMSEIVEKNHGRVVKFIGDGVLAVFVGPQHRERALGAVADAHATRQAFLDENQKKRLPILEYAVGVASGEILAGEIGTPRLRFFDVLGRPVNFAFKLAELAILRQVPNLVDATTFEGTQDVSKRPKGLETDAVDFHGARARLFRVET